MPYSEKDFSNCTFNPLNKLPMLEAYPQLKHLAMSHRVKPDAHHDKIFRYIAALYDSGSPLILQLKELENRKYAAAEVAGFDIKADEDFLSELFDFRDEMSAVLTMEFLKRFVHNRVWAMIVSSEAAFWNATKELMNPDSELDVMKTIAAQDKTHERLNEYYKQFYADASGLEDAVKKVKKLTPELIALNGKQ
jgi:hypothetical protein